MFACKGSSLHSRRPQLPFASSIASPVFERTPPLCRPRAPPLLDHSQGRPRPLHVPSTPFTDASACTHSILYDSQALKLSPFPPTYALPKTDVALPCSFALLPEGSRFTVSVLCSSMPTTFSLIIVSYSAPYPYIGIPQNLIYIAGSTLS